MQIRIKFCGITNAEDALNAAGLGVWALGFNFYAGSPRYISPGCAADIIGQLPDGVQAVGVFVNASVDEIKAIMDTTGISMIQLHGNESPAFCRSFSSNKIIKAFRPQTMEDLKAIETYPPLDYILLDAAAAEGFGGTGQIGNWEVAAQAAPKNNLLLAGGLTPQNVAKACKSVLPFGVDVASGVEESVGRKSMRKMSEFAEAVRFAHAA
jgi:phosphoribosylanthranilate isomerase